MRRAILLTELLAIIAITSVLVGVVWKLFIDGMYVQRLAAQKLNHAALADSLLARLRADALAAARFEWSDGDAPRGAAAPGDPGVEYVFESDAVTRFDDGAETHRWSAPRLRFSAACDPGPRGGLFTLEIAEAPPPRPSRIVPRKYVATVVLPVRSAQPIQVSP